MNRPNPDRRSFLALLGIAGGAFGVGLGGGAVALAPKAAPAALPAVTGVADCVLMSDGEAMRWEKLYKAGYISHAEICRQLGYPPLDMLEHL
ncbi:hypothetical protein CcrC1_gp360 [Caulobacter phage C1]|nr:hypothetical protein CcrC1_gp360 [Caulobacter phage C1]UTU08589.1 hypothetical protein CcrC2_gp361 [Caulobacter phage C2]UTU09105.1 hypothetical protein CcrJ4_gp356 [Caulobacter phage J4]UTU09663.1 hypothetical protein CcrBL47_gp378 [Caulobacter phage BL47]WGN97256.1 hypothetical protein [Bertelyvirus sp.]